MPGLYTVEERKEMIKINGRNRNYSCFLGFDIDGNRTWWLEAKYNNVVIHRFDEKQKDNYTKYLKFLIGLRKKKYDVSEDDMMFYKSEPFIKEKYKRYVSRNDLIKVASLVNYNEDYLISLKDKDEAEKEMFCWHMGISINELAKIMEKFN